MVQRVPVYKNETMSKRGLVGKIILGVFLFLVLIIALAAFYFYNFYVFETFRICVGNATNTTVPCGSNEDCLNEARDRGLDLDLVGSPDFIRENFQLVLNEALYCNNTCFVQKIRGINPGTKQIVELDSCGPGETEFLFEVHGKDGLEIMKWLKENNV